MRFVLVFDFGGVIVQTQTHAPRHAWDRSLGRRLGTVESIVHGSESWRQAQLGRITHQEHWDFVARQLKLDRDQLARLEADYFSADTIADDVVGLIERQRALGRRVALLSNDSAALRDKLDRLDLARLFDPIVISAEIGHMKPDPDAYRYMIDMLDVVPARTVFIDDMPVNVDGARAISMNAVLYMPGLRLEDALAQYLAADP
ncbi:MAG: HAD family phosphatase [Chloroflexi bacterium]|nr:HAD family phosphatase [Chloroflexota bacterium]